MKVLAAMSGGVDSAVAAARAAEAGHDVTGIHLALSRNPQSYRSGARGCCTIEDSNDARRAADVIGIPFYVWDLSDRFHEDVVEDFMAEYAAGRTPNPCLRCNEKIKFAAVLDRAARPRLRRGGHRPLRAAAHRRRRADRDAPGRRPWARTSPTCSACSPRSSSRTRCSRSATPQARRPRARPAARGLLVADKPDSHDICFVADGDNAGWLAEKLGDRPQPRRRHRRPRHRRGARQPRGHLRLHHRPAQGAADRPAGPRRQAAVRARHRAGLRHRHRRPPRGARGRPDRRHPAPLVRDRAAAPLDGTVQLRAHGDEHRAVVAVDGDRSAIELLDPAQGIAPGQAAVSTTAPRVVGSATISAATARVRRDPA